MSKIVKGKDRGMSREIREICGECKWHHQDEYHPDDYICVNGSSEYAGEYTDYNDWCRWFEQRGID